MRFCYSFPGAKTFRDLLNWTQDSKKGPSGRLGQLDFVSGRENFYSHLPNGQSPRQVIRQLNENESNQEGNAAETRACRLAFPQRFLVLHIHQYWRVN